VFGLYGAVMSLANVLGPVMGGLLTESNLFGLSGGRSSWSTCPSASP